MVTFPESWWQAQTPLVLGHRGASHDAPQNTLAAFRRAVEVGANGIELDVHLSRDGVPVVIHDAKVDATTDGTGYVSAMSLEELKALDAGLAFDPRFAFSGWWAQPRVSECCIVTGRGIRWALTHPCAGLLWPG